MFFFLRPKFNITGFWATHVPWPILFFLFPRGYIVLNEEFPEMEDSYWED